MGWVCETDGAHEGYLVAVVPDASRTNRFRELEHFDREGRQTDKPQRVWLVQVACDCGWRSARLSAPYQTEWAPSIVLLDSGPAAAAFEDAARALWRQHTREIIAGGPLTMRADG